MKMTIGAAIAMTLMLSLPLATYAQDGASASAPSENASETAKVANESSTDAAEEASDKANDSADNASDEAKKSADNAADDASDQAENRDDDAERASDEADSRADEEANSDRSDEATRDDNADRDNADRNNNADQNRANRNNQPVQPYTTGYRGAGQPQYYNNQPGQPYRQGQQAYYNDGYQRQPGQQQAYHNSGQQGHAGQQTAHHEGADHGWGEEHPSVGQQEWMCIDGRRQLVTIVSVSKVSSEKGSQDYPERAAQYEGGQQSMPAAPENFEGDRTDSQNDRRTPPPTPEPSDNAVQQTPAGSQPASTDESTSLADGAFEGAADRNGGRIEATEIRN